MSATIFLKGEWRNIVLANYEFDPDILAQHLPPYTELDAFNGKHYISLSCFLFKNTQVKGITIPFHRTFEEINLRFYVRHKNNGQWQSGVVFIKEIVPKKLVTLVGNKVFTENYQTCEMRHLLAHPQPGKISVEYMWKYPGEWNWVTARCEEMTSYISPGTEEEFICDQYHSYAARKNGNTYRHTVKHTQWRMHKVLNYDVHCDFGAVYGPRFAGLTTTRPQSVFMADGSEIQMHLGQTIG